MAVQQVRREVAYVQGGVPYVAGQLIAQAAMDYVAGHVSDTAYGYLQLSGAALPPVRANAALAAQAGICGQAAVRSRRSSAGSASRLEASSSSTTTRPQIRTSASRLYGGSWHFFDPTYGQFWTDASGDVLSISDVRAGAGTLQKDVASFTNVFEDAVYGNDTWFETDPATKLVLGAWVRSPSRR